MKKVNVLFGMSIVFLMVLAVFAIAAPNNPESLTEGTAESRSYDRSEKTASAYGSNMTQLTIDDARQTIRWQGYYGNISSSITLDDASNWTLYDWSLGTIEGEVYASIASVCDLITIRCINLSSTYNGYNCSGQGEECLNITEIEIVYGMGSSDNDGVDETFNETLGSLTIGTTTVSDCYMVNLFANDSRQSTFFWNETMLTINNTETIIYASIVNDDVYGYDNTTWDFQMIVGDNGDIAAATNYVFYVELS